MVADNAPNMDIVHHLTDLAVNDNEEGFIISDEDVQEEEQDLHWCLVGRFLTEKPIHFISMQNTLALIWKPVKGVYMRDLGSQFFMFQFFHELDIQRVEKGGHWTFDRNVLIKKRLQPKEKPAPMPLFMLSIWLQIYDLPMGFRSQKVCQAIGAYVGNFVESYNRNFDGSWKEFIRIRVLADVRNPLKKEMKLKRNGGEWIYIKFAYEHLPTFCFFCGIIGHSENFCEKFYDHPVEKSQLPFGPEMRATNKKFASMDASKYIRQPGSSSGNRGAVQMNTIQSSLLAKVGKEEESKRASNQGVKDTLQGKEGFCGNQGLCPNQKEENYDAKEVNLTEKVKGVIVVDAERRRHESANDDAEELGNGNNSVCTEVDGSNNNRNISKNLEAMGSGLQAHQSL